MALGPIGEETKQLDSPEAQMPVMATPPNESVVVSTFFRANPRDEV
jgi:hypothetical protein